MDDYGSFQRETGQAMMVPSELVILRDSEIARSESSNEGDSKRQMPRRILMPFLLGMSLWLVVMAAELSPFLFLVSTDQYQSAGDTVFSHDEDDDTLQALWGSTAYNIRMCSMEECISSPCQDSQSAPFVCLALKFNEKFRGGCGRNPWDFDICSDQCNTAGCSQLLERSGAASSSKSERSHHLRVKDDCDVECPREWCRRNRICGDGKNAPYQCTAGLSIFGCSSDKFEWTIRSSDEECSSCCKTTSCKG